MDYPVNINGKDIRPFVKRAIERLRKDRELHPEYSKGVTKESKRVKVWRKQVNYK